MDYINYKPFIKWVGGKSQLLKYIRKLYPKCNKYCEPFIGGGSVMFDVLGNLKPKEVLVNDINPALINTYEVVKNNVGELIKELKSLEDKFNKLNDDEQRKFYMEYRIMYNEHHEFDIQKAIQFIFLNKTCFNGLYRVNSSGEFNVPMGRYKKITICDTDRLKICSELLQPVIFKCGNYSDCIDFIDNDTFVYMDPPYRPVSNNSFKNYDKSNFIDDDQYKLMNFIDTINSIGGKFIMSNSDPLNGDRYDSYFDDMYHGYYINRVLARRSINSCGTDRGVVTEILVYN